MKKMYVLLLHGTWAGAARWTHHGSLFRERLEEGLKNLGYKSRFEVHPWDGENRWRARVEVSKAVNKHLDEVVAERDKDWEFLVVAHSHGGNIATDAVRNRLGKDLELPIRGVVCLNTPFLAHQLRGSSGFLLVWSIIALGLLSMSWLTKDASSQIAVNLGGIIPVLGASIDQASLRGGLISVFLAISILFLVSRVIQRHEQKYSWEPRPRVLCLSCPDDEAITFLGLGEGIANLPQLLLHPLSVALFILAAILFIAVNGGLIWCSTNLDCWGEQLASASVVFITWLVFALVGGIIGSILMAFLFGLSVRQTLATLVSRVLVSYVPLRPSKSHFRGISELPFKWSPLQLFHSGIYDSPQTVQEICDWLKRFPFK